MICHSLPLILACKEKAAIKTTVQHYTLQCDSTAQYKGNTMRYT